ncbi:winged helix-turn-helix domain-containing protein [Aliikangiella coralliicola]|uniref:OmpR/PhoB-type domain-containing protein n=1 Tax=Aliikangiella coralliicola TaxID=2592383 RepID=A0A545UDW6_9GAMM|nr:winged helix-turn-helix domain-containing protein [Aliikangiella coralliicola]TQV87646.1 hypothetical protein FLL46_12320 [Aliikangiella coralliicola]
MTQTFAPPLEKPCQFGEWSFDPVDGQLRSKRKAHRLQPRLAKLLSIFVANVHVLLSRETLIEILWQDKTVNEDALSRCVAELRSTLGDDRLSPVYIETVPKKGYRFIHPLNTSATQKMSVGLTILALVLLGSFSLSQFSNQSFNSNELAEGLKSDLISARRLTADSIFEHQPEISNHGDKVAFSVIEDKELTVRVVSVGGELLHEIKEPDYYLYSPTFSPDDQSLLIAAVEQQNCLIFRYRLASMQRETLGECLVPNSSGIFSWSPDGESFSYVAPSRAPDDLSLSDSSSENQEKLEASKNISRAAIWTYHLKTEQRSQLTQPTGLEIFDTRPRYSSDGKTLAFTRGTKSARHLYTIDIGKPNQTNQLTDTHAFIAGFSWLENNRSLLFDSDELGDRKLWLLDVQSKQKQILGARDAQFPSVAKKRSLLAFHEVRYSANIWSVDLTDDSQAPKKIIESTKYDNFPAFSPDGQQIAFTTNRHGNSEVWLYSAATQQQSKLVATPGLNMFMPNWSSDGEQLLVSSRGAEGYRCYQVSVKNGKAQPIKLIKQAHYACLFSEEGDIFAVSKVPDEISQLLKLNTDGTLEILTEEGARRIQITNSGTLIYSIPNKDGLYSVDLAGQNRQTILPGFNHSLDDHWTVQGNYLYYPKIEGQRAIWRYDLTTGKEKIVTTELPSAIGLTMSVNPQQTKLVLSRTDSRQSDIYLSKLNSLLDE